MADSFPPAPGQSEGSFPQGHELPSDAPFQSAETLLFRRYRVIRELGRGGMGVVLLAHDTALDIPVAMKLIPDQIVPDTGAINDLRQEVLRGMALMHPGIVRSHTFEQDESGAAIVMEYVDGWTLGDLKEHQPQRCFDHDQILPWLAPLCEALDYANREARIVHRDLKPRNIMLTQDGRIKVADFGISAALTDTYSRSTGEGPSSGTPPYMSPQQARGYKPSVTDDIYSLGATIYDLLTSKPPFFRGTPHVILNQVLQETAPTMQDRRHELQIHDRRPIPRTWEWTIAACLSKDPAQRPQSALELLHRLSNPAAAVAAMQRNTGIPPSPTLAKKTNSGWVPWIVGSVTLGILVTALRFGLGGTQTWVPQRPVSTSPHPDPAPAPIPSPAPAPASGEWTLRQIDGRDYVSFEDVGAFYGLGKPTRLDDRNFELKGGSRTLKGRLSSRELFINGIKFILSYEIRPGDGNPYLSRMDLSSLLDPVLRPAQIKGVQAVKTIVLDPAAGGHENGVASPYGYEKTFTLDVAQRAQKLFAEQGYRVVLTRSTDTDVALADRLKLANLQANAILISLGMGFSAQENDTGIETRVLARRGTDSTVLDVAPVPADLVQPGNAQDAQNIALATAVHASVVMRSKLYDGGVNRVRPALLCQATIPAIQLQVGFASNSADAKSITDPAYRQTLAAALVTAVTNYRRATDPAPHPASTATPRKNP